MEIKEEPIEGCNVHALVCSSFPDLLDKQEDAKVDDLFIKQEADEGSQAVGEINLTSLTSECDIKEEFDEASSIENMYETPVNKPKLKARILTLIKKTRYRVSDMLQVPDSSTVKQNDIVCKMPQIPGSAKAKLNVCSICGFQTIYTLHFSEHMSLHTVENSYQHSRSGFETAYLKHLETRMRGSMCKKCNISSVSSKYRRLNHTCQ